MKTFLVNLVKAVVLFTVIWWGFRLSQQITEMICRGMFENPDYALYAKGSMAVCYFGFVAFWIAIFNTRWPG